MKKHEEVKQDYVTCMGKELGSVYFQLYQEFSWLYIKWNEYVEMFGTKPSRIELLNKAAPLFFYVVQETLWREILLHIARLTDSEKTCGKQNLTIKRLPGLIKDKEIRNCIVELIEDVGKKTEFCRDRRHRILAHTDLGLSLQSENVKPLQPASRESIRGALSAIEKVLTVIHSHFMNMDLTFSLISAEGTGAREVLDILSEGLDAIERKDRRLNPHRRP